MAKITKTDRLTLRMKPVLRAALEALAEHDQRSIADYVHIILEKHVARQIDGPESQQSTANRRNSTQIHTES